MTRPVIVGVGEIKDRPAIIEAGLDPLGLMAQAARRAERDTGSILLQSVDAVEVIHQISWRYEDTARKLCERIGINPPRAEYHPGGGESPLRVLHEAALRIARGESRITLICGGEARSSLQKARKAGVALPWPTRASEMEHPWRTEQMLTPMGMAHGLAQPTFIYPLYENATVHSWGLTPRQAQQESAALWERYASVAAANPCSWSQRIVHANDIASPGPANPMIAWPYTRFMVANPTVNLGAAVLLMSDEAARQAGIARDRILHIVGGAAAKEADDYLARDRYDGSPSQKAVLESALALNEGRPFDALELYSCFPCVPKMARRELGLPEDVVPTVTGGLTFFGGPFNNYMLHATCAMVRHLRSEHGRGLLYGQGDFVTKHHAIILSNETEENGLSENYRVDGCAAALRGPIPDVVDRASGPATVETFTILYDRAGEVDRGIVILRTPSGARTMARVPVGDRATIARLADQDRSPIGETGSLSTAADGLLEWTLA